MTSLLFASLTELIHGGLEPGGQLVDGSAAPVMEENDRRLRV